MEGILKIETIEQLQPFLNNEILWKSLCVAEIVSLKHFRRLY